MPSPLTANPQKLKDPVLSANVVGLRYVTDQMPGIRREKSGAGFRFRYPTGQIVRDHQVLRRIQALAIPPAWSHVWICPDPCGHLQATGRDDRGRKQNRYHPRWREIRDRTKYARMLAFARALPKIRRHTRKDLKLPGLPRTKVLATVVRLLELSLIRVGNDEYARNNDSFGLTTMRNRHVRVNGSTLRFQFRGKAGKRHQVDIHDRRLARIVKSCQDLPGQELFQYVNDDGQLQDVHSEDVNEYLREISGEDFTAKDFRTWVGTVLASMALQDLTDCSTKGQVKKNVVQAIHTVAQRLGNTPSVCKKCYIHPDVLAAYQDGSFLQALSKPLHRDLSLTKQLRAEEAALVRLLKFRLRREQQQRRAKHSLPPSWR